MYNTTINELINIGFCQPRFYKRSVWLKAKRVMELLCKTKYVGEFDFGRGKGKYTTSKALDDLDLHKEVPFLISKAINVAIDQVIEELGDKFNGNYSLYSPYITGKLFKIFSTKAGSEDADLIRNHYTNRFYDELGRFKKGA